MSLKLLAWNTHTQGCLRHAFTDCIGDPIDKPVHFLCTFYIRNSKVFAASVAKPVLVLHGKVFL